MRPSESWILGAMTRKPSADNPVLVEPREVSPNDDQLFVHVAEPQAFYDAHIPDAVHVAPGELVCGIPPATGRLPSEAQLNDLFARIGYDPARRIIAYDDEGGGWAGRFVWTLDVIGHRQWGYLNGGIHAWRAAGLPLASGLGPAPARSSVSLDVDRTPIAEIDDVLRAVDDPAHVVWDVRSLEEFRGERRAAKHAGHIPGAVHLDWMALKNPDDDLRLVPGLQALLNAHGLTKDKAIITHCQTHHRSGLSYMAARLLGYANIRAYDGSWSEWGNRDDVPITIHE